MCAVAYGPMPARIPLAVVLALLTLSACHRTEEPAPPVETAAAPAAAPSRPAPARETVALDERRDPGRVLRFYAAALHARDWTAAAKAWGPGSGVTAETLKSAYDRADPPVLELGEGQVEGAAGSLYYEAPVVLRFGNAPPERGSLVLRRVNDVPGASAAQLRWHIERAVIGELR